MVTSRDHAVVIGGGFAGLIAARVLHDHYTSVTVVEQGILPEDPTDRKHVPQGHHFHLLLGLGVRLLTGLMPGLGARLDAMRIEELDFGADILQFFGDIRMPRMRVGIPLRAATRPMLEWAMRTELQRQANVEFRQGAKVVRLLHDGTGVTGVVVDTTEEKNLSIQADLVVETTGRNSRLAEWLFSLGYGQVEEQSLDAGFRYTSAYFKPSKPVSVAEGAKIFGCAARFPNFPVTGGVLSLPDGIVLASLVTLPSHGMIKDASAMLEAYRSLPWQGPYCVLQDAEQLTPIRTYSGCANVHRRFDRMARWPHNLVAMGDSVCSFNPRFGQGMTVAALGGVLLDRQLRDQPVPLPRNWPAVFMRNLNSAIRTPWAIATSDDLNWLPDIRHSLFKKARSWYAKSLLRHCAADPNTYFRFMRVANMLDSPIKLVHPKIVLKTLARSLL